MNGLIAGVNEIGFETVERLNSNAFSFFSRVLADSLEILHHQLPLGLPFLLGDKLSPAYGGIDRPDQSRRVKDNGDIDQLLNIIDAGSLLLLSAAQIPSRTKSAAERATHQTVPVQFRFHEGSVDVGFVLDSNLHRIESPSLEILKEFGALIGKG